MLFSICYVQTFVSIGKQKTEIKNNSVIINAAIFGVLLDQNFK
jgi:hypothetical protein